MWKDIETGAIITREELMQAYLENFSEEEREEITFGNYLHNCQSWAGGTLEAI